MPVIDESGREIKMLDHFELNMLQIVRYEGEDGIQFKTRAEAVRHLKVKEFCRVLNCDEETANLIIENMMQINEVMYRDENVLMNIRYEIIKE